MPGVHEPLTDALLDPATYAADVHVVLDRLRAEAPLAWNGTAGFWAVTRHADVAEASSDPSRFCSAKGILVDEIGVTYDSPPTMMHADPPEHTRYRKLVRPGFTNAVVRQLEVLVRERTGAALDALAVKATGGAVVDITTELAIPLPIQLIAQLLGLPEGDEERLFRWSEAAIPGATDWSEEERGALLGEMTVELLGLAAARRQEPHDDVVSMLATYEEDGEALTDDELGMFLIQLLVAGNETTRNAISGALVALAEHPGQLDRLAADPARLPTAVEEVLRWTTPVTSFMRTAVTDTDLGGTPIRAGDPLLLIYAAANRDEAEFGPTAGTFDVDRTPNHHLALGHGPHFCLGAALARLELSVVLEGVTARWSRLRVAGPIVHSGSSVISGIKAAPLTLEPR
ncbi:MAG: cytochrome P450 [Acidimicrobiales bacterium]